MNKSLPHRASFDRILFEESLAANIGFLAGFAGFSPARAEGFSFSYSNEGVNGSDLLAEMQIIYTTQFLG